MTGDDEIVIQGDVKDDLWDVIPEKWPEVGLIFSTRNLLVICIINFSYFVNAFRIPLLCSFFAIFVLQIDEDSIDDLGDQKR